MEISSVNEGARVIPGPSNRNRLIRSDAERYQSRHHVGKMKFTVANWSEYEDGLHRRGNLSLSMTSEALSSWSAPRRTTLGGPPRYSDLAIKTALTLGLVLGLRPRQTEDVLASMLQQMGLDLAVPDCSMLSRRAGKRQSPDSRQDDRGSVPARGPIHVLIDSTGLQVYSASVGWQLTVRMRPL